MKKSTYFQAKVERSKAHVISSTFQFVEHVAFYRTFDVKEHIWEFFVPADMVDVLDVIRALKEIDVIHSCEEKTNRF